MIASAGSRARPAAAHLVAALVFAGTLLSATDAQALPAFARKYGTSCLTCHTVYPHLTPFGEAFRRNGYRFPGKDQEFWKQETVPLGQEAYKSVFPRYVWPGTLPDSLPVALAFNGAAAIHPDSRSSAWALSNNSPVTLNDLVGEAHLFTGGSFDDSSKITFFGEITLTSDPAGPVSIEHARIHFNDLLGPPHLLNIWVGRGFSTLTSYGMQSSYIADMMFTSISTAALFGAAHAWDVTAQHNGIEINGMAAGRFIYSLGVNTGDNRDIRAPETAYAHLGFKVGGMRLDGEGEYQANPEKPWAETALTLDLFGVYSKSHTEYAVGDQMGMGRVVPQDNQAWVGGLNLRFTVSSFELTSGVYFSLHDNAQAPRNVTTDPNTMETTATPGDKVEALVQYNELSYIVFPWLVPAVRVEYLRVAASGCDATSFDCAASDLRISPGVAFLIRPNLKLVLSGTYELATGALNPATGWGARPAHDGRPVEASGWAAAGGYATPGAKGQTASEFESIQAAINFAF